jgi:CRISPR-associated protein Cmr5
MSLFRGMIYMQENKIQTRSQIRAQNAFNCVSSVQSKKGDYKRLSKKFPALVHTCGLTQAIAFVQGKEKEVGSKYLKDISVIISPENTINLADKSRNADLIEYQHMTRDVIDAATWLKRYSEALLEDD